MSTQENNQEANSVFQKKGNAKNTLAGQSSAGDEELASGHRRSRVLEKIRTGVRCSTKGWKERTLRMICLLTT